jgi:hypothetical protein
MTFLADKIIRLDAEVGKLTVLHSVPEGARCSIPLSFVKFVPFVEVEVAPGRRVQFKVDTGFVYGPAGMLESSTFGALLQAGHLTLTEKTAEARSIAGVEHGRVGRLKRMRVGEIEDADLEFKEGDTNILSLNWLSHFLATFDFPNGMLHLERRGGNLNRVAGEPDGGTRR